MHRATSGYRADPVTGERFSELVAQKITEAR